MPRIRKHKMKRRLAWIAILTAALIATRWTLAPKYLFYIDNINFALAMRHFQPLLHQPHPPGYPFYVALLNLLHLLIPSIKYVQLLSGTVGSLAALLLIWKLGDSVFASPAGSFSAAILFFLPAFWLAGIGNQVRTFLAAGSIAVALCAWKAIASHRWLFAAAAVLGVAAGFRPELLFLLSPLLFMAWFEGSRKARDAFAAAAILSAVTAVWLGFIIWKTGGPPLFFVLLATQWRSGPGSTTLHLFNAALATYWTGIAGLSWIGAGALVWRRIPQAIDRRRVLFFTCWFLPPFLFHALIYITDPDTALDCMPALIVIGGWVLSMAVPRHTRWAIGTVAAAAMAINVALFFLSPLHQGRDASYAWVRLVGSDTATAIDGIAALSHGRPATVILHRALVTPRQIAYYFPQVTVVTADGGCSEPFDGPARLIYVRRFDESPVPPAPFRAANGLAYTDLPPGARLQVGACN